ncbi:hypothetical protein QR680_001202 [Steinernema hermaphroditum]|uniref:Amino acid permease/ SLC12A domain-containing protein n=1 Tax=Steinernema hermaphroditum TaxID=289476 RepID=A0AA39LEZ9_9BILA|nr:hypothetical protein QR680_001202 [Steinernema hermaphroditum]
MSSSREKHQIGALAAVAYCAGDMIGSGIFISPTAILSHTGSVALSLIVWVACAVIAVVGALVYIELGTSIRRSGCDFAYLSHAEWHFLAVAFLWVGVVIQSPCVLAIQSTALSQNIVGGVQIYYHMNAGLQYLLEKLIAIAVLLLLGLLNMFSLKQWASKFQIVAFTAKILTTILIIGAGIYYIAFQEKYKSFNDAFENSTKNPGEIVLALYAGLFAYEGWCILNYGLEEIANPKRVLPIAALGGIGISATVYVLMNVSYFALLTVDEFKSSDAVAVAFSKKALSGFAPVLPFLIALLLLSNLNTTIFSGSRHLLAGAQRRVAPTVFSLIDQSSGSPRIAIVTELVFGVAMLFAGDLSRLISYMTFAGMLERVSVVLALFYMRYKKTPMHPEGIRYPIILPLLFLCINITLLVIPLILDFTVALYGLAAVFFGLLVYFLFIFPNQLPMWLMKMDEGVSNVVQRIFGLEPSAFIPDECVKEGEDQSYNCESCDAITDCNSTTHCIRF